MYKTLHVTHIHTSWGCVLVYTHRCICIILSPSEIREGQREAQLFLGFQRDRLYFFIEKESDQHSPAAIEAIRQWDV